MRFDTFGCGRRQKNNIFQFFGSLFMDESGPACEVFRYLSNDRQKFAVVLCCAGRGDTERVGRDLALSLGSDVVMEYLRGKFFDEYASFKGMIRKWNDTIAKRYGFLDRGEEQHRRHLYRDCAPSFMAVAGSRDEILLAQCGDGLFFMDKNRTAKVYDIKNSMRNKTTHMTGFAGEGDLLYVQRHRSIPDTVVMVSPYASKKMWNRFLLFLELAEQTDFRDPEYCLAPFYREAEYMGAEQGVEIGIAGYRVGGRIYDWKNAAQAPGQTSFGHTADLKKKQCLKKLDTYRKDLQKAEEELTQLKQIQTNIRQQQQSLEAAHQKTLEQLQAQENYLKSKQIIRSEETRPSES